MAKQKQRTQQEKPEHKYWAISAEDTLNEFSVEPEQGLSSKEARSRLRKYGSNALRDVEKTSAWEILINQLKSLIVLLLVAAAVSAMLFHQWMEAVAIGAVIVINTMIGFVTEIRAVRSMEALQQMGTVTTKVRRDGDAEEIKAQNLVPGDMVILEEGDIITADLRIIESSKLMADESALTGESLPVSKNPGVVEPDAPLAERTNILYKGTAVTRGSGEAVVVSTGMKTELGKISSLVAMAEEERTPLEKRIDQLGRKLIGLCLIMALIIIVSGLITGKKLFVMIETGIALAVASIPEGLPIVATIALARGMARMAAKNALIRRLSAVETLGATNVIFTDKTGTLTENRMNVSRIDFHEGEVHVKTDSAEKDYFYMEEHEVDLSEKENLRLILETGILCNNAYLKEKNGEKAGVGEPLEIALLEAGEKAGIHCDGLYEKMPELREEAFDSETKKMATFNKDKDSIRVSVKGAPEAVLENCSRIRTSDGEENISPEERKKWLDRNEEMAAEGLRLIAAAVKYTDNEDDPPYENLTFLGLVGMLDPPRSEVKDAIDKCRSAGIRVVVVTGDQLLTARNISARLNIIRDDEKLVFHGKDLKNVDSMSEKEIDELAESNLFARVSPEQKLQLIELHQKRNRVTAMTGDGVNDAPALKKADIGVAMGKRGTQVAREAADMVLRDDFFGTIVNAVEQGRIIFGNIRKFIYYLLSFNLGEVLVVYVASFIFTDLPLLPLQILYLNFVTDVFPALALGFGEGAKDVMSQPPRDASEPILTKQHWMGIIGYGLLITVPVLAGFGIALRVFEMDYTHAVTVSFLILGVSKLLHLFNITHQGAPLFINEVTTNGYVWGAIALCIILLLAAVNIPFLADILHVAPPDFQSWLFIVGMSAFPLFAGQIIKRMGYLNI